MSGIRIRIRIRRTNSDECFSKVLALIPCEFLGTKIEKNKIAEVVIS